MILDSSDGEKVESLTCLHAAFMSAVTKKEKGTKTHWILTLAAH